MSAEGNDTERLATLEAALSRMPTLRREIFLAIRLDDMTYSDIAERTGFSERRIQKEFIEGLVVMADALEGRAPRPWWRRLLRRVAVALRR